MQRDDVVDSLVGPLPVVMLLDAFEHIPEMVFTQGDDAVERGEIWGRA